MIDPRHRFSSRVGNYVKFRPGYPAALVSALLARINPANKLVAADIGSGTGLFTRLLLAQGVKVYGVEPNANMRDAAETDLASYGNFVSVDGSAEHTGLDDGIVDLVTAAQSFHWFNNDRSREEFGRILKKGGNLALIWNRRKLSQPFQQGYDALLREFAPGYENVNHMNLSEDEIAGFFSDGRMEVSCFDNSQQLDFNALIGRLGSSSYCPDEDSDEYETLISELRLLHEKYATGGIVKFEYDTRLYLGPIAR